MPYEVQRKLKNDYVKKFLGRPFEFTIGSFSSDLVCRSFVLITGVIGLYCIRSTVSE